MFTLGFPIILMAAVALEVQPVAVSVKVNVAVPAAIPVTTPAFDTVAIAELLLTQVPPVVGDTLEVVPSQIDAGPVMLTVGFACTVIALVGKDMHPVDVCVKVNVALPGEIPVTKPPLVTVAIEALLLDQVPPVVGDKVVVEASQIVLAPVILTVGFETIVTAFVEFETQEVEVWVKVNVTDPTLTPVTTPALVTVAIAGLLLTHVPPVVGESVVVDPSQIEFEPVILTVGLGFTVTTFVLFEVHPVEVWVNLKVAVPPPTPVTTPALFTVATEGLLLTHVPPEVGFRVVVVPSQIVVAPEIETVGFA